MHHEAGILRFYFMNIFNRRLRTQSHGISSLLGIFGHTGSWYSLYVACAGQCTVNLNTLCSNGNSFEYMHCNWWWSPLAIYHGAVGGSAYTCIAVCLCVVVWSVITLDRASMLLLLRRVTCLEMHDVHTDNAAWRVLLTGRRAHNLLAAYICCTLHIMQFTDRFSPLFMWYFCVLVPSGHFLVHMWQLHFANFTGTIDLIWKEIVDRRHGQVAGRQTILTTAWLVQKDFICTFCGCSLHSSFRIFYPKIQYFIHFQFLLIIVFNRLYDLHTYMRIYQRLANIIDEVIGYFLFAYQIGRVAKCSTCAHVFREYELCLA